MHVSCTCVFLAPLVSTHWFSHVSHESEVIIVCLGMTHLFERICVLGLHLIWMETWVRVEHCLLQPMTLGRE